MRINQGSLMDVDLRFQEGEQFPDSIRRQVEYVRADYGGANGEWWAAKPTTGNELSQPNWETVAFRSPFADSAYLELTAQFRPQFPGQIHLNSQTGLPGYLYCDFANSPWQGQDPRWHTEKLMAEFSLVLSGHKQGEVLVSQSMDVTWEGVFGKTRHLRYSQNVWGGHITFTFDSRTRLALITSSLFPVNAEELEALERGDPDMDLISEILAGKADGKQGVPKNIGFSYVTRWADPNWYCYFPFQPRDQRFGHDHLWEYSGDGWRNPPFAKESGPKGFRGEYRPAWRIGFVDAHEQEWIGFVDVVRDGLLYWTLARRSAAKDYAVFNSTQEALAFENTLLGGDTAAISAHISSQHLARSIWLGIGAETLRNASRVHLTGDRLKDKYDPAVPPAVTLTEREMYLGANVMYHAKNVQLHFLGLLSQANILGLLPDADNPVKNLNIVLDAVAVDDSPYYDPNTGEIHFPKQSTGAHPVWEPGYDGEVIAHEITHAVMHAFCGQLFQTSGIEEEEVAARAVNEGLAFYAACDYFADPRWAEFAYKDWQQWRDILTISLRYDDVVATLTNGPADKMDPSGVAYGIAMWWAHVLWELRIQFPSFNFVLLRALHGLSRIQPTTQAAGTSYYERIRNIFRVLGAALRDALVQDVGDPAKVQATRDQVLAILHGAGIEPL